MLGFAVMQGKVAVASFFLSWVCIPSPVPD
jgi:hypothetical protein